MYVNHTNMPLVLPVQHLLIMVANPKAAMLAMLCALLSATSASAFTQCQWNSGCCNVSSGDDGRTSVTPAAAVCVAVACISSGALAQQHMPTAYEGSSSSSTRGDLPSAAFPHTQASPTTTPYVHTHHSKQVSATYKGRPQKPLILRMSQSAAFTVASLPGLVSGITGKSSSGSVSAVVAALLRGVARQAAVDTACGLRASVDECTATDAILDFCTWDSKVRICKEACMVLLRISVLIQHSLHRLGRVDHLTVYIHLPPLCTRHAFRCSSQKPIPKSNSSVCHVSRMSCSADVSCYDMSLAQYTRSNHLLTQAQPSCKSTAPAFSQALAAALQCPGTIMEEQARCLAVRNPACL